MPPTSRKLFVNLPVGDLDRSVKFFTSLGFTFDPNFTDENATCMIISDEAFAMLLVNDYFKTFTSKPISDASSSAQVLLSFSAESREEVDHIVKTALANGGSAARDVQDMGFMYQGSFNDPDGHGWEVAWMDMSAMEQQ